MKRILHLVALVMAVSGCEEHKDVPKPATDKSVFTVEHAKDNLAFAKAQYLKLLNNVNKKHHLNFKPACLEQPNMVCVPRSEEHDGIYMEQSEKWTNGFFPGVLWKLLSSKQYIDNWLPGEEQALLESAQYYQSALFSESQRGSTHDLGFILNDSFGEALTYPELDPATRSAYDNALKAGRKTLATRYREEKGVIRSWDWIPRMRIATIENGEAKIDLYTLSNPWTYPVIVDNMMNLEFLFDSDNELHHEIAFSHAKQTSLHHYFYDESDTNKQYPIAYHVFDYGSGKPGNWQGVGNVSAWARGQGWSLYGFVTVVEAMVDKGVKPEQYVDFHAHLIRLFESVEHLLSENAVPYWDFFASRDNANKYAENISTDTTVFSGILGLCDKLIEEHVKPYNGYRPMQLEASMLSKESIERLQGKINWHGEPVLQGQKLVPCGSKPYPESHSKIPRDSSAASIYAAAMYRYASFTQNPKEKERFAKLANKIMSELSSNYRTDRTRNGRPNSVDFGFVLAEATGDMGKGAEVDTPIVYGDFYFIEANIRKIEYEQSRK